MVNHKIIPELRIKQLKDEYSNACKDYYAAYEKYDLGRMDGLSTALVLLGLSTSEIDKIKDTHVP